MHALSCFSHVWLFPTLWTEAHQVSLPTRFLCPWDCPGKNTRMGCHDLLQGIFLTQGLNPHLLISPALADRFFTTSATWEACMLLLSRFSRVWLCATPETAAHQAPLSLGFSRQEHWSGLPFPSPMHESEKGKWSCSVVSDPQRPHGLQPQASPSMGFSRQEYLIYNIALISSVQKSMSVMHIHISALYLEYSHISHYSVFVEFPVLWSRFLLVTYFTYSSVYMSIPISQFVLLSSNNKVCFLHLWFYFCFVIKFICTFYF